MMQNKIMRSLALAAVLTAGTTTTALAQSAVDGAVGGVIHDQAGAIIPGAQVTVTNNGTAASQTVKADDQGYFRALHLQPGTYTVEISAPSFGTYKSTAVLVQVGLLTNVESNLAAAGTTTEVNVTSEIPAINTTSPDFNTVIDSQILQNLPVNNYRWSSYAALTPGVVSNSDGFGLLSFRGQSVLQNNITIDGADDNQAFFAEERGRTRAGYSTAQSSIQEFQVNTSNYSVEYGRAVGGVVNSITKSGTNAFHGDLYFRDRDAGWGTKSPTTALTTQNAAGAFVSNVIKPKDWRKQFGGSIGGFIVKDKIFFFFAGDKFKRNFPGTAIASSPAVFFATPNAALPAGRVCGGTGATAPATADAAACTLSTTLTTAGIVTSYSQAAAAYTNGLAGLNSMLGPVPRTGDQNIFFPKIDWQVNSRNRVTFEVNRLNWASPAGIQTQASNSFGSRSFGDDFVKLTFGVAKLDSTITTNLVNEVRYQYGRDFEYEFAQTPTAYEQANLLRNGAGNYTNPFGLPPQVAITNGFTFGTSNILQRTRYPDERRWQVADTANWSHGSHNVKFGLDYLHTYDLSSNLRSQFGAYSYNNPQTYFADLILGQSNNPAVQVRAKNYTGYSQAFGPVSFDFVTHDIGIFAQDEWKASRNLSLTYGLRYELQLFPSPYAGVPVNGASFGASAIPQTGQMPSDKNNLAPRVGFAYDPFGDGRTSIRGGFGLFFGRTINSTIYSALTSTGNLTQVNGSPVSQATFNYTSTQAGAPSFPQIVGSVGTAGAAPASTFFQPGFQNPYSQQFDLSIQRDLGWHTSMAVTYMGALGRRLPNFVDANLSVPTNSVTYTVTGTGGPLVAGRQFSTRFYPRLSSASTAGYPATCTNNGPNAFTASGRPNPCFGAVTAIISQATSSYHGVVVEAKHQITNGLSFNVNYTYSHALDNGVNSTTFTVGNAYTDALNPSLDYGNSDTNVPHRFVAYAVYVTPKHFNGLMGYLLNSYEIAPSFSGQSGLPYSAASSGTPTTARGDNGASLSALGGGVNGSNGAFRIPILGRNTFRLPRTWVADLRLSKRFDIRDGMNFEVLIESFNILNHYNTTQVNTSAYNITTSATSNALAFNSAFGTRTAVNSNLAYSPRQVQVGARFHF
jgi:hypothetical protein